MGCIFSSPRFKVSQIDLSFWTLCFYNLAVILVDYIQTCPSTCTVMYLIAVNLCEHAMCGAGNCHDKEDIYSAVNRVLNQVQSFLTSYRDGIGNTFKLVGTSFIL
ncbi:hypothetical protein EB796_009417 [Bugula neritina]|uniref:Uncharacterized protein n=1 Tax=Bugula neritina TaxID=10212 RepID=A0A7J7K2W8_BUGNE|nr:hypothetical protein EB796_009417 [Bugula neritina]